MYSISWRSFTNRNSHRNFSVQNLDRLRKLMQKDKVDAVIVPSEDPHMSEYPPMHFARRAFLSGFTGSAGVCIVTQNTAALFTDGRYWTQADQQIDKKQWVLMRTGQVGIPSISEYIVNALRGTAGVLGLDPWVHSLESVRKLQQYFEQEGTGKVSMQFLPTNLVDDVWEQSKDPNSQRPAIPTGKVRLHPIKYAGLTVQEKLTAIRATLKPSAFDSSNATEVASALVLCALDEIAYVFNIRGADVPCNPVTLAYSLITQEAAYLFVDRKKLEGSTTIPASADDSVLQALEAAGVQVLPYETALSAIQLHATKFAASSDGSRKIWMDSKTTNFAIYRSVAASQVLDRRSPVALMKAVKNEAELKGMRACHERDGAAMVECLAELDELLQPKAVSPPSSSPPTAALPTTFTTTILSELQLDELVQKHRKKVANMLQPSFDTIAGFNSNAAIIHYRATESSHSKISGSPLGDMILLDSGGQYDDGTTDITRTIHSGQPTAHQQRMFTLVLKGHISLDSCIFPAGTPGVLLDAFARRALWSAGRDYSHGTGHGVGAALCVHEGPQRISKSLADTQPLLPGMIVSNEPGYYEEGNFGIRIENLLVVVPHVPASQSDGQPASIAVEPATKITTPAFLAFEKLTYVPIQHKLIDFTILTLDEIQWLDEYHKRVREKITPMLHSERAHTWLHAATRSCSEVLQDRESNVDRTGNSSGSANSVALFSQLGPIIA